MSKQKHLKEGVKELMCLYSISHLNEDELSVSQLLQKTVAFLPGAMQHSDYAAASIEFNGETFSTENFTHSEWMLSESSITLDKHTVRVHVAYPAENWSENSAPFLDEERVLIRSVACHLALKIDRIFSKNERQKKTYLLNKSYNISGIRTWELDVQRSVVYGLPFIKDVHRIEIEEDENLRLEDVFKLVKDGESRQVIEKAMANAIENGDSLDIEVELVTGEGDSVWVRIVGEPDFHEGTCIRIYGTLQNIENQKRAELEVKRSREKLQKIMNQSPDVICTVDAGGRFVEVSEKSIPAWGYKPGEMEGKPTLHFVFEEDIEKSKQAHREIVSGREMNNFENRYVHKNGSLVPIIWSAKWDENDQLMYCVARDGTEKKKAEKELQERSSFIEAAFENLPIGIVAYQKDTGKAQIITNKYSEIAGWPKEDLTDGNKVYRNLFPDEDYREKVKSRVLEDIESGDPARMTWDGLKITTKDGEQRIVCSKNIPITEQNLMISTLVDVTEQKIIEQQLNENKTRFKALVQEGSDLLVIFDQEGVYNYVSPTSENILGIKPEHFIGKKLLDFIHESDKNKIKRVIKNLPELKRFQVPPIRFRDVNYKWRWLETTITNMMNEPAVGGYVANSRDITERMNQQEKLQESLEEKEVLLSEIHHRVKNNLAIVSGILQLQAYDEENSEILERLSDSIFRIQTMASIHELLYQSDNFSRLIFSEITEKLIYGIDESLKRDKSIEIIIFQGEHELNINQAIPCSLIINEVVTNIYKHAFKNRSEGKIRVNISEENESVFLEIEDDGVGLPEGLEPEESTSLGMNLIRILSIQLEGEYHFNSSEEGTIFTLKFKKNKGKELLDTDRNFK